MEITFDTLVPRVQAYVNGCPHPTVMQHVRDAMRRVCERTLAWRYEVPKFKLTPGVHQYYFNVPAGSEVHAIFGTSVNGNNLEVLTLDQALARYPNWADLYGGTDPWEDTEPTLIGDSQHAEDQYNPVSPRVVPSEAVGAGTPLSITQVTPDQYTLLPLPDDTEYWVRQWVALKPKRSATGMNDVAFLELEDATFHSALQYLYSMPNTAWHDKELASYHAKQTVFFIAERRARANLGNARGMIVATAPPFM